ncbi:MAG: M28 family peptidase, partial [Bryobacteraceae bacterium]
ADLNLEQVGRTDSSEGPHVGDATLTGFDYTTLTDFVRAAGRVTGIKVYQNRSNSDLYFSASDNQALADMGVPAETLCVAFQYPDYHGLGDEWQKIDYANMAKVDRMVALAAVMVADTSRPPHWSADNPKVERYRKAWEHRHAAR